MPLPSFASALGRAIGLFALLGFFATLAIHAAAVAGVALLDVQEIQFLMSWLFFVFGAAALRLALGQRFGLAPPAVFKGHSRWTWLGAGLLAAYVLADFLWGLQQKRLEAAQDWPFGLRQLSGRMLLFYLLPSLVFLRPRPPPG